MKLGIVGTGYIAGVVAGAVQRIQGLNLAGVASRRLEHAQVFAQTYGAGRVFENWEALVVDEGVEAVYVATPTAPREMISVSAARQGKHVLAEKPFLSLASLQKITTACRENHVAFLDATHFSHHPRTLQIKQELAERVGVIQAIHTNFFFPSMDRTNIRYDLTQEPTGAIGDMAWYAMRAIAELVPAGVSLVSARGFAQKDTQTGAIVRGAGVLLLSDGSTSTWNVGYNVDTCVMDLQILGSKGMVNLDDFVLDWAEGFPVRSPGYPVGFTHRAGLVPPAGFQRVVTPGAPRQVDLMLNNFMKLAVEPASREQSIQISERTQCFLDAIWENLSMTGGGD